MSSPTGSNASAGIVLVAVSWTFFVVSLVVVALRFYADIFIIHLVRIDSYLTFLTFVSHASPQFHTQIGSILIPTPSCWSLCRKFLRKLAFTMEWGRTSMP